MSFLSSLYNFWGRAKSIVEAVFFPRRVIEVAGDVLPAAMPRRDLVLLIDDGASWSVGMRCPCGCNETLELILLPAVKPNWKLTIDKKGRPSLSPSVWRNTGCRSHFWLRDGKISWC